MERIQRACRAHGRLLIAILAVLLVLPSLAWIALDRQAWPWDPAWYGELSVDLYYLLRHDPALWPRMMGTAFGQKAPGIAWIGQFFVPLGQWLGSIDAGLLVSIVLTQMAALALTGGALLRLSRRVSVAVVGLAALAAGPLFVALSHQYYAEPLQTLAVAWFLFIAASAPGWGRLRTLGHLLAAAALAMLAKVSSPLYCLGPGLVALGYAFRPGTRFARQEWRDARATLPLLAGTVLAAGTAGWYVVNWRTVAWHVSLSSFGPTATLFGWEDTFLRSYAYWLRAAQQSLFLPQVLAGLGLLLGAALILAVARAARQSAPRDGLTLLAVVAAVEVLGALALFARSPNRENRYLLPLAPYVAVLVAWALAQVNRHWATALCLAAFLYQGGAAYAQTLGLVPANTRLSPWLLAVQQDGRDDAMVEAVVSRTCASDADAWRYNIVGVDTAWLNHNTITYYAAKRRLQQGIMCRYTGLGFAEADAEKAWERLLALNPRYYITAAPDYYPPADDALNLVSREVEARALEGTFTPLAVPLAADLRVEIYLHTGE